LPQPSPGWVHQVWAWSPIPWIYKLYYLQYLFIAVPGIIVGDLLLNWMRGSGWAAESSGPRGAWPAWSYASIGTVMLALPILLVIGLKVRWLVISTAGALLLCGLGWWLMSQPRNALERLFRRLFNWAIYWLMLGLVFEPFEGGIKKDHPTMSYYFVTSGLAICVLICLTIVADVYGRGRSLRLLTDNGQNPMIAYAGINNLILPLLGLTSLDRLLSTLDTSPWLGFVRAAGVTLLLALSVSLFTRLKVFWRT